MANTYGLSGLVFGINPSVTGYVTQGITITNTNNVVAEVLNESGQRVASRYDDLNYEIAFEAIFQGATVPLAGVEFTYNSIKYEVLSVDFKYANKEYEKVSIKGRNSANITLP